MTIPASSIMLRNSNQQPLKNRQQNHHTTRVYQQNQTLTLPQQDRPKNAGFSFASLLIAIAFIGVLFQLAIPQLLNARIRGQAHSANIRNQNNANSKVSQVLGISHECALLNAEAIDPATPIKTPAGDYVTCGGQAPTAKSLTSLTWAKPVTIACLGQTFKDITQVTIEITDNGQRRCRL